MRKEWLGITLALGLGLNSSVWAAKMATAVPQSDSKIATPQLEPLKSPAPKSSATPSTESVKAPTAPLAKAAQTQTSAKASGSKAVSAHVPSQNKSKTTAVASSSKTVSGNKIHSGALQAGITQYNHGFIAKAIPLFEQATQQNPQSEMAFLWLAKASQKQGTSKDIARSKEAYQKTLAINPNNEEALSALGEMWSWDPAMRGEAVGLLKRASTINPRNTKVAKNLAEALLWQGNPVEALQAADPIARIYRNDKKWLGEYAQMLAAGGRINEAMQIYQTDLKGESDHNVQLRMEQVRALWKNGNRPEAMALFDQIAQSADGKKLARNPKLGADFGQSMGGLAFEMERYGDALQWDQSLPEAYQRHKDIQLREARALERTSRVPEAIDHFNRLYEAGLLTVDEKLEFAEYLRVLHLAPDALPSPNLVETLYQDAIREGSDNPEVQLRLARYYGEAGNQFEATVKAYQAALSNPGLMNLDADAVKKEYLDYLKSDKTQPKRVEALFKQALAQNPNDIPTQAAYAEYLSWQKDRKIEALRYYVSLSKADPENHEAWQAHIDDVLKWQTPTTQLVPLYQEIVNLYPQDKTVWTTVARAYRNDKDYYKEAVDTYGQLVQKFPDDGTLKREWLGLLLSNASKRGQNITLLKNMSEKHPNDPDLLAAYGKLLSYDHHYGPATDAFERALKINAAHREALVGKGYVILWSGRKLEAKNYFAKLRGQFPDDVDIAIGLAQAEKQNGRYDHAMHILQEIKPLMDRTGQTMPNIPSSSDAEDGLEPDFQFVANWEDKATHDQRQASYDFSMLPFADDVTSASGSTELKTAPITVKPSVKNTVPSFPEPGIVESFTGAEPSTGFAGAEPMIDAPSETAAQVSPFQTAPAAGLNTLHAEIDAFTSAVDRLKQAQQDSRKQLDHLGESIRVTQDAVPTEMNLQAAEGSEVASNSYSRTNSSSGRSVGESGMKRSYGVYSALDYDTNPLLSGLGRFRNDDLNDLEKGLSNDLRPMIRGGYLYTRRNGQPTTTRLSSYGFPNQLSFSLTPQIRLRGGVSPTRYYLPDGLHPSVNWGTEYSGGATIKYWDRLTLDGDLAVTHFSQTQNVNLTYQGQAQYAFNDSVRFKLGASRLPQFNSLLSVAGQRPNQGFYQGQVLGQARENSFFGELNTNPFNQNWDWNLGYAWALVTGRHIPDNYKNQAFTSLGHTWHMGANHKLRMGYEFLYFGYQKNATNGYFDTTAAGLNVPVSSLNPLTVASSRYVYGGYYSPSFFMMNAGRMDLQGSFWNKMLEYKIGGSLGVQSTLMGHDIHAGNGSRLSGAFDTNLIYNMTDWLAAYGDVDYLNAGGQFNRWRFGGGLIVRPHINALSPMFGGSKTPKTASTPKRKS
jgi:cytochrome c-type biogenesis protein CcmH/NrfG